MADLDPELSVLLAEKRHFEANPDEGSFFVSPDKVFYISIKFSGDINELTRIGFQIGSVIENIAFGAVKMANLGKLASHPNVETIGKQRKSSPSLDKSVPNIQANQIWERSGNTFTKYTGRGVIIGIVDSGIDFTHHVFRKANGETRIRKIWDQTLVAAPGSGSAPGPVASAVAGSLNIPLNYGVEYGSQAINDTIRQIENNDNGPLAVQHKDLQGHGTHVAGIAAGDGSQQGACMDAFTYIGVAPEAEIVVVRLWGPSESGPPPTSTNVLTDAVYYILNEAKKPPACPVAINISMGVYHPPVPADPVGAIDTMLAGNPVGVSVVFGAGNHGDSGYHASLTIPAGSVDPQNLSDFLTFAVDEGNTDELDIVIAYQTGTNFEAKLQSPIAGSDGEISWVPVGGTGPGPKANGDGGRVSINHDTHRRIIIKITPPPNGTNVAGRWVIDFKNPGTEDIRVDAFFWSGSEGEGSHFVDDIDRSRTLSSLASGHNSIAVGSYAVLTGKLSSFSSWGPTLDTARTKPEICAPGEIRPPKPGVSRAQEKIRRDR